MQQVEESCSWNLIGMFDNLGCHSNGYVIKRFVLVCLSLLKLKGYHRNDSLRVMNAMGWKAIHDRF